MLSASPKRQSGIQTNYRDCPICGSNKWKLYVDENLGVWYCFAMQHARGGKLDVEFSPEYRADAILRALQEHALEERKTTQVALPYTERLSPQARAYLSHRGVTEYWQDRLSIREGEGLRVVIPFFDPTRIVVGWQARAYSSVADGPKYMAAPGSRALYVPDWERYGRPFVLVEGPFDAIAVLMHTDAMPVALCGSTFSKQGIQEIQSLTAGVRTLILLDRDALKSAVTLAKNLPEARIVRLPDKDPADTPPLKLRQIIEENL